MVVKIESLVVCWKEEMEYKTCKTGSWFLVLCRGEELHYH